MDWVSEAACRPQRQRATTYLFFTETLEDTAKRLCFTCPVRLECLEYALTTHQEHGVWGGLNEPERRARQRSVTPSNHAIDHVTYTTNARSTGATCSAGRSDAGWGVVCHSHGSRASAASRTIAEFAVSRPEDWCAGCGRVRDGLEPKLVPTLR